MVMSNNNENKPKIQRLKEEAKNSAKKIRELKNEVERLKEEQVNAEKIRGLESEVERLKKELVDAEKNKKRQGDFLREFLPIVSGLVHNLEQYNHRFRSSYPYIEIMKKILKHLTVLAGLNTEELCKDNTDFIKNEREELLREWEKVEKGTVFHSIKVDDRFDKWYPILEEEDRKKFFNIPKDEINNAVCQNVLQISREFAKDYPDKKDALVYKIAFEKIKPYILECKKWSMTGSIDASAISKWVTDMVEEFQFDSFPKLEWISWDKEGEHTEDYYAGEFDYPALYYCTDPDPTSKILVCNGAIRKAD